jgi:hypothetical protein
MNKKLADFIVDLAVDPARARRFVEDAAGELTAAGLSAADQAALLSKDTDRVRTALGNSFADHMTQFSGAPKVKTKRSSRKKGSKKKPAPKPKAGKKR